MIVKKNYGSQALFIVTLYQMQTRFYIEKRKDETGKLILKDRPVFMSVSIAGDRAYNVNLDYKKFYKALEIFSLYKNKYYLNNTAFPSLSIITMNKYLKILASEAGLNRKITAGMGVNTFLANAIRLKVPLEVISGFTGVKNDSRFRHIRKELEKLELEKFADL